MNPDLPVNPGPSPNPESPKREEAPHFNPDDASAIEQTDVPEAAAPAAIPLRQEPEPEPVPLEPVRHYARGVAPTWEIAHNHPDADLFSPRIAATQSAFDQVFQELDRRPMPTYKPGEPLDPLLELRENPRLLQAVLTEIKSIRRRLAKLPSVIHERAGDEPRVITVADAYLQASSSTWWANAVEVFLVEIQRTDALTLRELWAFPTAIKFLLLEEILTQARAVIDDPASHTTAGAKLLKARFQSIRDANYANWPAMIENLVVYDAILRRDPSGAYPLMDFDSREAYRERVAEISRASDCSESEVAEAALRLAQRPRDPAQPERLVLRRAHVGYYLVDKGFPALAQRVSYRPPFVDRVRMVVRRNADDFYIGGALILTVVLIGIIVAALIPSYSIFGGLTVAFLLLLLPAAQGAVDLVNNTVTALFKPNALPKMDFSKGIPSQFTTLVAVPTLLLRENQVRDLFEELEVRYLANQDAHIHFAILSDLPDSVSRPRANDTDPLVELAVSLVNGLNARYAKPGGGGFFLLHRHRIFNARQGVWMGWERKRGKLLDLNKLLTGTYDSFPVKAGNLEDLESVRYVITLDSDTQLPRGTAHSMIGAMAHPLNRAVIDPESRIVTEGYGILQPRVGVSVHSASRSRLAAIYSGQTGFDIYTRAISDAYQDLYGEGSFTGKGIFEVATLHAVLDRRFPRNSLLSHDLIEGAYARAGLVTDIEVIDDYPSHYSAYRKRQHRWVRGDWQIAQWMFGTVPDESGRPVKNPISTISRWKIFDNLRRSLVEPFTLILLVAGWLGLPGGPVYWTLVTLFLLFVPTLLSLIFGLGRAAFSPQKGEAREAVIGFSQSVIITLLNLAFLPHQTLLTLDAIIRALVRRFITGQRLLEWETAAQAESVSERTTPVDRYLRATPLFTLVIAMVVAMVRPSSFLVALPILILWGFESGITAWLNKPPHEARKRLTRDQDLFMRSLALRTWRFFYEYGSAAHNYLIPDNVEEESLFEAGRVSPTNFGLLLNARQAAHIFGYLTVPEFADLTQKSLATYERLEKRNGHIYNWYDTRTLAPIRPITISSVDSGNLAASFYTLRSGTEALLRCPLIESRIFNGIRDHLHLLASLSAPPTGITPPPLDDDLHAWVAWALQAEQSPVFLQPGVKNAADGPPPSEAAWWLLELRTRIRAFTDIVRDYLPWLQPEFASLRQSPLLQSIFREAETARLESLAAVVADLDTRLQRAWTTSVSDSPEVFLAEKLRTLLPAAQANFEALSRDLSKLAAHAERCVAEMDFAFLIEPSRQILSIGYMVEQEELHKACYDLLCSEARIAAFIAVAKGEATQQSWFKLGRIHTVAYGRPALISWTGTMFEYLMPALWMRAYPDTLVTRTLDSVVHIQRAYASEQGGIPWGVSECGYAQKDDAGHYHYLAFGMPAIALKWDAIAGPVISPYSTFLALTIDQAAAMRNLERMAKLGWIGAYGFYEAADYQDSTHEPKLVREWMAHHQGMSMMAVLNLIHDNITQDWFHANANLKATELLLHEKPIRQAVLMAEHKQSTTRRRKPAA